MKILPAIIVAIGLVLAPLIYIGARYVLPGGGGPGGPAIDSSARIEIENLRGQIGATQQRIEALEATVSALANRPLSAPAPSDDSADMFQPRFDGDGKNGVLNDYASVVLIANRRQVNDGLTVAGPTFLENFLGRPREDLSDDCQAMTNPELKASLVVDEVGPIKVQMLQPAIDSLRTVFRNIEAVDPDLFARINTAGSLCIRRIRGTQDRLSTHSFGLAVDLNIDGHLDTLGDGNTQLGLTIIYDFFNAEGWVWGASFGREDSMHFEVSRQQLEIWRSEGKI